MDRADSCSKRTNPSGNRPDQVEAAERQPFASRYRRAQVYQGHQGLDPAESLKEDRNHRTKRLLRWLVNLCSLVGDKAIPGFADNLVGESRDPAVVEGGIRPAGDKEILVVEGTAFLAVEETVVA